MIDVHLDFETYSTADLLAIGAYAYAENKDTRVQVISWAEGDEKPHRFIYGLDSFDVLTPLAALSQRDDVRWWAHNATFEYAVWNYALVEQLPVLKPLKPEQVRCTMALAYHMGLPGGLDEAARSLGLKFRKDIEGHKLMMRLCKPQYDRSTKTYQEPTPTAAELVRLADYCQQDVVVERELHKTCMKLSGFGTKLMILDRKINDRGVYIEETSVTHLSKLADKAKKLLNKQIAEVTDGYVPTVNSTQKIGEFIRDHGVFMPDVTSPRVLEMLADEDADYPEVVRKVLQLRSDGAKTSTAKLKKMLQCRMSDGRVRGMFQYHGAQRTGRFAGRLIQLQNLFRPVIEQEHVDMILERMEADPERIAEQTGKPIMASVASCLRGCLTAAPGNRLMSNDFSNIEGRVLAWLANERWKLRAFEEFDAGTGPDLYLVAAGGLYDCSVEEAKPYRQVGKVFELSMGFGGGYGAYRRMGKANGVELLAKEDFEPLKWKWRDLNSRIKDYWTVLEEAAIHSVRNPGKVIDTGKIKFHTSGTLLRANLPSGRNLHYPFPEVQMVDTPFGPREALTYMGTVSYGSNASTIYDPDSYGSWQRISTWGGKLAENMTQAVAADVLFEAMIWVDAHDYPIVLHVHDEIVAEVPERSVHTLKEMAKIMSTLPDWADGLPVTVEGWEGKRYRK